MEILNVVLMADLTMKDGLSKVLSMHVIFFTPSVDDNYYLIRPLAFLYVDVCRDHGDVYGMVDIRRVY